MDETLRAGDRDREEVVALLREGYAQGRLTPAEFDERITAAYAARTLGELRRLVADLPVTRPADAGCTRAWSPARTWAIAVAGVCAAVVFLAAAVFTGHALFACPPWLAVFIAIKIARSRRRPPHRAAREPAHPGAEPRPGGC